MRGGVGGLRAREEPHRLRAHLQSADRRALRVVQQIRLSSVFFLIF
jgi:hypothetical protein